MAIADIDAGIAKSCPLGRLGVPADIGRAISLHVSPESEWINGMLLLSSYLFITETFKRLLISTNLRPDYQTKRRRDLNISLAIIVSYRDEYR